ncbi:unnamed protein product [Tuber aestivum]|uniref:BTB domain-containing protein n=1 Tax=Tuber aestivum TaxID=59557 RepID=A0A292PZS6_9PEZI|nr:unnamed protein product [Tuber aestivum]
MSADTGDPKSNTTASGADRKGAQPRSPFETQIFQITAQGGERCFYTHASILSKCSGPLRSAVEGDWKESSEHIINLNDWDGGTVERLLQFLHTGGYQWPLPEKLVAEKLGFTEAKNKTFTFSSPPTTKAESYEICRPLTPIDQLVVADETPIIQSDYNAWLSTIKPSEYDLGDLLLSHAKIYALASYKDIEGLKRMALNRTLKTLTALGTIESGSREVTHITQLLKYVYENTTPLSSSREPMRKLVVRFTALNLTILNSDNKISGLMSSIGGLTEDLMSDVTRRVQAFELADSITAKLFISDLEVRIGGEEPWNCVREYNWGDPNLNSGIPLPPVWLVPKYTEVEEQACTSFEKCTVLTGGYIHDKSDVIPFPKAKGILMPCRDGPSRIRHVQLLRTSTATTALIMGQQVGKTGVLECINYHSPPGASGISYTYLHLMWKY